MLSLPDPAGVDLTARILVLTQAEDPTADLVLDELNRRAVRFFRCDPGDFPTRLRLTAHHEPDGDRWHGWIHDGTRGVRLERVRTVYYRRPSRFRFPPEMSEPERRFAEHAARHGFGGLLAALRDVRWVNRPSAMADARVKPFQHKVASDCGLRLPATLVTSEPSVVPAFGDRAGRIVTKPLATSTVTEGGRSGVMFTSEVGPDRWTDAAIGTTAHLFQCYADGVDVRLTMVGDRVFAAAIHPRDANGSVDIRAHRDQVSYEVVDVPAHIEAACGQALAMLGLVYGAFDFRVSGDDWLLLELNPNGQWAFVPELLDPIAGAIADLLDPEAGHVRTR